MVISHGKTLQGTPESAALMSPFVTPASPHPQGVLIGLELMFNFPVPLDLYLARQLRLTHSARYQVSGQLDSGKSAFMKALARRTARMKAFDDPDDPTPVDLRVLIHDRKMGEYRALTETLHSTVIRIGGNERFNPFDPRLSMGEVHMVDIAANLCEMAKGNPLTGYEPLALQIGVYMMLQTHQHAPSIERLETIIMNLTADDIRAYYRSNSIVLSAATDQSTTETMAHRMERFQSNQPEKIGTLNVGNFMDEAGLVASYLGQLRAGRFGRVLGGEASMFDRLTQRVTTIEWEESNQQAQDAVEGILWKWRSVAKYNRDLIKLIPHLEIGDEEGKARGRSPLHLRFMSEAMRDARALHTAGLYATQFVTDTNIAGGDDPSLQAMAEGIENAVAGRIIFQQPNEPAILERLAHYGFSDLDAERVTRMPPFCAAFKLPYQPPIFLRTVLTASDRNITYSNKEGDKMVARRQHATDDPEYVRRARLLGVEVPGYETDDKPIPHTVPGTAA